MGAAKSYEKIMQEILEKNPVLQIDPQKIYQEALQGNSPGRDGTPQGDPIGQTAQTGQIQEGMRPGTSALDDNRLKEEEKQHPDLKEEEVPAEGIEKGPDEGASSTAPNPLSTDIPQLKRE